MKKKPRATGGRWERDREKEAYWKSMISKHGKSGQSIRHFCLVNSLSESSFSYWRRELELRSRESTTERQSENSPFIPITIVNPEPTEARSSISTEFEAPIEIVSPSGYLVRVSSNSNIGLLPVVMYALGGQPC